MKSKIALGTAQMGMHYGIANNYGKMSESEASAILSLARARNIDIIDTAIDYGESEMTLGRLGVSDFNVMTKLPALPNRNINVHQWVEKECRDSLARLGVTTLHGLLLHRPEDLLGDSGKQLADSLQRLKSQGLARKIGVSLYQPNTLVQIFSRLDIDIVQAPLNLIDRRLVTSGWLKKLKDAGVEIHSRSTFLQGLLLMPRGNIPARFERWSSLWDAWARWQQELDISPTVACLSYPLSLPEVDRVVIGIDSLSQLTEVIHAAFNIPVLDDLDFMATNDELLLDPYRWNGL